MKIRSAQDSDRDNVLIFCKDTFSWGDYIADVWDKWKSKGGLYVLVDDGLVVGVYNIATFERESWIEGMRVHPQYRKKGFGTKMLTHAESVIQNKIVRLIIESENRPSINLAESMGYGIEEKWRLYSTTPQKQESDATIATTSTKLYDIIDSSTYADSWKWFSLDDTEIQKLVQQKRVIVSTEKGETSAVGIYNRSNDFAQVFQLGFVNGTADGMMEILKYVRNRAHELDCERVQVFAQEKISLEASFLDKKSLFYLMKKELYQKNL
ncbi:MAG: GNAT family N-acetyltransferase [Nitrosotalea sp.]